MDFPILSALVFVPLIGGILALALRNFSKVVATVIAIITLLISLLLVLNYNLQNPKIQFIENSQWIKSIGVTYTLGVDGISLPLVVLTAIISLAVILYSPKGEISGKFLAIVLFAESGIMGVFTALDFILFFLFWELVLIVMYFIIQLWGSEKRAYAAIKFLIYTQIGSVVMLIAIFGIYIFGNMQNFQMVDVGNGNVINATSLISNNLAKSIIFLALFFSFAIKIPLIPFHTWLPDAHVEAPTGGSVLLAALLLKMGGYGLIRIGIMMMPETARNFAPLMLVVAVVTMLYGAIITLAQRDFKRLVAYSSVSHMGYVLLGISSFTAIGISGSVFQMFSHGLISAIMFMVAGILKDKFGTRIIEELGGIAGKTPRIAVILTIGGFALMGLPGTANFTSEIMVFIGAYTSFFAQDMMFYKILVALSTITVLISAAYVIFAVQRVVFGHYKGKREEVTDIPTDKFSILLALLILLIILGIFPSIVLQFIGPASESIPGLFS